MVIRSITRLALNSMSEPQSPSQSFLLSARFIRALETPPSLRLRTIAQSLWSVTAKNTGFKAEQTKSRILPHGLLIVMSAIGPKRTKYRALNAW